METEKKSKGLIVLVVVLIIFLLGALAHICYNKFYIANEEQNKVNKLEEKVKKQELEKEKLSEVMELYKSLTDGYNAYGLYFGKKQTIETVPVEQILPYVIYSFIKDKNYDLSQKWLFNYNYDYEYVENDSMYLPTDLIQNTTGEYTVVLKKDFDKYFKDKFNTKKILKIQSQKDCNKGKCYRGDYTPRDYCIKYLYDIKTKSFYFACSNSVESDNFTQTIHNKFIKYETDNENIYIYDRPIVELNGFAAKFFYKDITKKKSLIEGKWKYKDLNVTSDIIKDLDIKYENLNAKYIFENYSEYLDTYKHTFKKAENGKYYWYSSEIVK